jgi:hypothetical protein
LLPYPVSWSRHVHLRSARFEVRCWILREPPSWAQLWKSRIPFPTMTRASRPTPRDLRIRQHSFQQLSPECFSERIPGWRTGFNVRSPLPLEVKISVAIGVENQSVTVTSGADLVETDPSTHTDVDRELFDKLPLESASSSLSSLVTLASPGVSADSERPVPRTGRSRLELFSWTASRLRTSKARSSRISSRRRRPVDGSH